MNLSALRQIIKEEVEKYKGGLYQVQIGDMLTVGIQGTRYRQHSKVVKILPDGKVVDSLGNTFNPNGTLHRSTDYMFKKTTNPNKVASAKVVTQPELDKQYKKIKIDFLKKFDWDKLNIEDLEKIIDQLHIKQVNKLIKSRFK